jgi:hypothetical protein
VVIEELDPALIAAVDQTDAVRYRPRTRYESEAVLGAIA